MLSKRIIPCLDVREGKTTKGIKFKNNVDIGDPVDMARLYYEAGADEIVSPNAIGGLRMASILLRPVVISFLDEMLRVTGQLIEAATSLSRLTG